MSELQLSNDGLDEEIARAEVYGLLAQLYQAPPAPELLANLRVAATEAPVAAEAVRDILRSAERGIGWAALVNHPRLDDYSYDQILEAFDRELRSAHLVLGAAATRYFWVGP